MSLEEISKKTGHNQPVFSVSELSGSVRRIVEDSFSYVRVRGELSGFKRHSSGHLYFNLKDDQSVLASVCWKNMSLRFSFEPEDGMEVICSGRLSTFPGQSRYQLIVTAMEPAGLGSIMAMLEKRRQKLIAEGLFDAERKRPIPRLPKVVGVITSPTGAVIRDILHRIRDRFPLHVLLWPVPVQGDHAPQAMIQAIRGFNDWASVAFPKPDVLILARGGGSVEDLLCFSDEMLVRAIVQSHIPIISAVGHETDTTLADYAADLRAPTPTAAAEMAVPVRADLRRHLHHAEQALDRHVRVHVRQQADYLFAMGAALPNLGRMLDYASQRLEDLAFRHEKSLHVMFGNLSRQRLRPLGLRLRPPAQLIQRATEQLRRADGRRLSALPRLIGRCDLKMHSVTARLQPERFARDMVASREVLNLFQQRINYRIAERVNRSALELHSAARLLEHADYRKVLARGFALVTDATGKHPLTNAAMVQAGESLRLEFHDGVRMAVASEDGAVMPAPRRGKRPAKSSMLEKTPIQPEPAQAACDDGQGVLF